MENKITEEEALGELEKGYKNAEELLEKTDKLEEILLEIETKLKDIPKIGEALSYIPTLISMVKSYIKKEYTGIPVRTIVAIISALVYFLIPIDVIPDVLPIGGYVDDATVILACIGLVGGDIKDYVEWREKNKKK